MAESISLPGLIASSPLSALASFGLLRVLTEAGIQARLCFELQDDWVTQFHDTPFLNVNAVVEWLADWIERRETPELSWAEDVRVAPEEFRRQLKSSQDDSCVQGFLSAMAAEGVSDRTKGLVKPSPLYMVSGQQSFFGGLKEIHNDVRKHAQKRFQEALMGPWRYEARLHSLGWDPAMERLHALRWREPAKKDRLDGPRCVSGAVWLAYESMPLLPCFSVNGRARCVAFRDNDRKTEFIWPVFERPVGLGELKSLLQTIDYGADSGSLRAGLGASFAALRFEFGQGYAVFRPARPAG
jgi:hypothetical protein